MYVRVNGFSIWKKMPHSRRKATRTSFSPRYVQCVTCAVLHSIESIMLMLLVSWIRRKSKDICEWDVRGPCGLIMILAVSWRYEYDKSRESSIISHRAVLVKIEQKGIQLRRLECTVAIDEWIEGWEDDCRGKKLRDSILKCAGQHVSLSTIYPTP